MTSFGSAGSSIDGLSSGLNSTQIINSLLALEARPQTSLKNQKSTFTSVISAYQAINAKFATLQTASQALNKTAGWNVFKATSTSANVVAQTGSGALAGSLSFVVDQLAKGNSILNDATYSSLTSPYGTAPILLSKASGLGFATLTGTGLAIGGHALEVTQSSAAATKTGTSALAASTAITTGVNDTIDVTINGTPTTLTIAAGTYNRAQLATAVQVASGGSLTASATANNALKIDTVRQGSAATVQVTGGSALTDLALSTDGTAILGTDGLVTLDGTLNTVTDTTAAMILNSGTGGTMTATSTTFALVKGTTSAKNISVGDGTLASVVTAVNNANAGVTATAIKTDVNSYRLAFSSTTTGKASAITMPLTGWTTTVAGQDAKLTVGSGPSAFSIYSASNNVSDVLPGVTLSLNKADPLTTVSVDVVADGEAIADKVAALAAAANDALSTIRSYTGYDPTTKTAGPLIGNSTVRTLETQVINSVLSSVAGSSLTSGSNVGLSYQRDGKISFDRAKFLEKYNADPLAVGSLFKQGGTATNSKVAFSYASEATLAGTYDVVISAAATQATATGAVLGGGTITAAETIDLKVGSTTVSYAASAGESLSSIATALNNLSAASSLGLSATVESNKLVVRTAGYGTGATFEVKTSTIAGGQTGIASVAGSFELKTGVNVAGTINGVAATGAGQYLSAPSADPTLSGLALIISAEPADISGPTNFGTFTYAPGIAQRIASVAVAASTGGTGVLAREIASRQSRVTDLDTQIAAWDLRLQSREASLRRQYSELEVQLGRLRGLGNALNSQIQQLAANTTSN